MSEPASILAMIPFNFACSALFCSPLFAMLSVLVSIKCAVRKKIHGNERMNKKQSKVNVRMRSVLILSSFKAIANTPYVYQVFRMVRIGFDLFAQPAEMNSNRMAIAHPIPKFCEQLLIGKHMSRVLGE